MCPQFAHCSLFAPFCQSEISLLQENTQNYRQEKGILLCIHILPFCLFVSLDKPRGSLLSFAKESALFLVHRVSFSGRVLGESGEGLGF